MFRQAQHELALRIVIPHTGIDILGRSSVALCLCGALPVFRRRSEGDDFLGFVDGFEEVDRVGELSDSELPLQAQTFEGEAGDQHLHAGALDSRDGGDERTAFHAGFDGGVPEDEGTGDELAFGKRDDEVGKRLASQLRSAADAAPGEHQQEVGDIGGRHPDAFFEIHVLELLV